LTFPAIAGFSRVVAESPLDVAGLAEPGMALEIHRNGLYAGEAFAAPQLMVDRLAGFNLSSLGRARLSADGRFLWVTSSSASRLVDLETFEIRAVSAGETDARWAFVEPTLYTNTSTSIRRYDVESGGYATLATADSVASVAPSPDGLRLAVIAKRGTQSGVWSYDLATGSWSLLASATGLTALTNALEWSPDGSQLAFQRKATSTTLEIVNYPSGTTVVSALSSTASLPSWSPDGAYLLWGQTTSGLEQVWKLNAATLATTQMTTGSLPHAFPSVSPDGRGFVCVEGTNKLQRIDFASGAASVWTLDYASAITYAAWASGGQLALLSGNQGVRVTPAGRFALASVELEGGDNRFVAHPRALSGSLLEPSAETIVHLLAGTLPNLVVLDADLAIVPGLPMAGSVARLSVVVRNLGGAASPAADLSVAVTGPEGFAVTLADALALPALAPGQAQRLGFDLELPLTGGAFQAAAVVDGLDRVTESSEDDNLAERTFLVAAHDTPQLELATDRAEYAEGETAELVASLVNPGPSFDGSLRLSIEDLDGFLVEELAAESIVAFDYGETLEVSRLWSNLDVLAGSYQARARLFDAIGVEVAYAVAPFRVGASRLVAATVVSDRASYPLGSTARLSGSLRYELGNALLDGAEASLRVENEAGTTLASWTE
ncbi:MAG: CARDB domain-containing protein, partial [Candidatus Binatia bacterium]